MKLSYFLGMLGLLPVSLSICACGGEIPWNLQELQKAPATFPAPEVVEEGVRAFYFAGLPYQGKATRVFAFYGVPKHVPGERVPAIILVHGGLGTAFARWVRLWNSRGYAAIAFDHDSHLPIRVGDAWRGNPEGGPKLNPGPVDWPITDQWAYHAVADALLAHALLKSFPEVDPDRIGITGNSWGGVVTSIVAGVDPDLKFAIPVYGCGFLGLPVDQGSAIVRNHMRNAQRQVDEEKVRRWQTLWDPANYLPNSKMPMLWVSGTNDFAFTPQAWQGSYRLPQGPRTLCQRVRLVHSQQVAEPIEEIRAFADSVVKGGVSLARFTDQGMEGRRAWAQCQFHDPLSRAVLNYTCDTGIWQKRKWETIPAVIVSHRVSAVVPSNATAWYFNVEDSRGLITSSEHQTEDGLK